MMIVGFLHQLLRMQNYCTRKNIVTSSEIGGVAIEGMAGLVVAQNMGPTVEILIKN